MASMMRWVRVVSSSFSSSYPARMLSMVMSATPPDEGGAAETMRQPRYSPISGVRSTTRYCARSLVVLLLLVVCFLVFFCFVLGFFFLPSAPCSAIAASLHLWFGCLLF